MNEDEFKELVEHNKRELLDTWNDLSIYGTCILTKSTDGRLTRIDPRQVQITPFTETHNDRE